MIITREQILKYWLSEPVIDPVPEGCVRLDFSTPCFPDLTDLNPQERKAIRDLIAKHAEYLLYEITISPNDPMQ
jgi:hypothetical protein